MPRVVDDSMVTPPTVRLCWDRLLDGQVWLISAQELDRMGRSAQQVRSSAYAQASRRNLPIRTVISPQGIYVVASKDAACDVGEARATTRDAPQEAGQ